MTYATEADFIAAFGEREVIMLTNQYAPTATVINSAKLLRCQADAKAIIDGMIATCPEVAAKMPFAVIPPLLTACEIDICWYRLDNLQPREGSKDRYDAAIALLKLVGACKMSLGLSGAIPAEPLSSFKNDASAAPKRNYFGGSILNGY